jgi:hypothetical protein
MEAIMGLLVIGFIAVVGTLLYLKSKKETPLGKGGSSGTVNNNSDKTNLKTK